MNRIVVVPTTTPGMRRMPKLLTIAGMAISAIILLLFLFDLIGYLISMPAIAPFKCASPMMDIVFVLCAGILAFLSWSSFRELQ